MSLCFCRNESSSSNTNDVTDQSDNANDSDGNALNDSNVTTVGSEVLSLVSTKEDNVTGELSVGDVILYLSLIHI